MKKIENSAYPYKQKTTTQQNDNERRFTMKHVLKNILPLFLVAVLSASCGSSGSSNGGGTTASGGIGGTGISQGTIEGFGSIIRGGVKFNTDGATFIIDDNQSGTTQDQLRIGQVVTIKGTINDDGTTGTATEVEFENEVEGPVDGRDDTTKTLTVLGRTVIIDDSTKIEDNVGNTVAFATLGNDDMLEVSGLAFADDKVQATLILKRDDSFVQGTTELELRGTVLNLNTTNKTFTLASQSIDYSGSITFERMTEADLANGLLVEVKGTRGAAGTALTATRIQKEDAIPGLNANEVAEIEGLVTTFISSSAFSINGQAVDAASAVFEDGAKDDVAANVRLEVEGRMNAAGVLVARKVKFHENQIRIEANVESVSSSGLNTVTLLGKAVVINGAARLEDKDSGTIAFSAITAGDRLEIRGYLSKNGVVTATRVERNNDDQGKPVRLQAPVEALANPNLTLLGLSVNTSGAVFKDVNDAPITAATFFSQAKIGTLVKTKGTFLGGVITAEEVEFED